MFHLTKKEVKKKKMSLMLKSAPSVRLQTPPIPIPKFSDKEYQEMVDLFDETMELMMEESGEFKEPLKEYHPPNKKLQTIKE